MDALPENNSSQSSLNTSSKKNPFFLYTIISIFCLIVIISLLFFLGKIPLGNKVLQPQQTSTTIPSKSFVYQNKDLGFSLNYPDTWKVKESKLRWGSTFSKDKFSITAIDADVELITLSKKDNLAIYIAAQKKFKKNICDGVATTVWKYGFPQSFKKFKVLDREVVRPQIELGAFSQEFMKYEPYSIPIAFKRLKGEYPALGKFEDYPNAVIFCFEKEDKVKQLKLTINYYSNDFTNKNIVNYKIDKNSLEEMDKIISSLKFN